VTCPSGNVNLAVTNENNVTFDVVYKAEGIETIDGEKYPESDNITYKLIKNGNDFIINNLNAKGSDVSWDLYDESDQYKDKTITRETYTATLNYINGKYIVKSNDNVNYSHSYTYIENNQTQTESVKLSFNTVKFQIFNVDSQFYYIYEDTSKYSALINGISLSGEDEKTTLNGKKLVVTKDDAKKYHFNMSVKGYPYYNVAE
jgi:hypothetical protein